MMKVFRIECGFPFPLIKERFSISHSLIERPSGLSYLLLVTIEHSKMMGDWNWIRFFNEIGIQKEVEPLLNSELKKLIEREIVCLNINRSKLLNYISMPISFFEFTEKGKIVFRDKQIPSDIPGKTEANAYYLPYRESWALSFNPEYEIHPLQNSSLSEDFVLGFVPEDDDEKLKELLEKKRGSAELAIKKEERILNITRISDPAPWYIKIDGEFNFSDNFSVSFDDKKVQDFFDKYYDADLLNRIIGLKSKFSNALDAPILSWNDLTSFPVSALITPDKTDKILKRPAKIFLNSTEEFSATNYSHKLTAQLQVTENHQTIDLSFASFDGQNTNGYSLARIECQFKDNKVVYIPCLIQFALTREWFIDKIRENLKDAKITDYEEMKNILDLTQPLDDSDFFFSKLKESFSSDHSDSLSKLYSLRGLINREKFRTAFQTIVREEYDSMIQENISGDNFTEYLSGASWAIRDSLISQTDALQNIGKKLSGLVTRTNLFTELKKVSFSEKYIAEFINPLADFDEEKIYEDSTLMKVKRVISDLKELKRIVNIKAPFDYTYADDISLADKIDPLLKDAKANLGSISIFKTNNSQTFKEWGDWISTFETILANLRALGDTSLAGYGKEKLKDLAKRGEYLRVCISLCQNISNWLAEKLGKEKEVLVNLINEGEAGGLLTHEQACSLHDLRRERNRYAHPTEEMKLNTDLSNILNWIDLVFAITEKEEKK